MCIVGSQARHDDAGRSADEMKRRIILAVIFAALLGATMCVAHGIGWYAIGIWRHPFWTSIIVTVGSIPYWMVFAPLLFWGSPHGVFDTAVVGWLCGIVMSLFWGFLATYVLDRMRQLRRRTIVIGGMVVLAMLASVSLFSVRRANCSGASQDQQVRRSQACLDKLDGIVKAYNEKYHHFPVTIQELNAGFPQNEFPFSLEDPIENGLLFRQKYVYRANEERTQYTLSSLGVDGREGTADDLHPGRQDARK